MGGNTNITTNKPAPTNNRVFFTKESQLPAPSGGVITLKENTTYIMYNDQPDVSQKRVTIANRIVIPDAGGVRITSFGVATSLLVYTGTGTFITTSSNFTGFIHIDELFISCPNGTLFDIDGVLPVGSEFFPRLFLSNTGTFDTDTLGTIKTISVNFNIGAFFSCKQGIIFDGVDELLIGDWRFANWQNDANSVMLTAKNTLRFPKIQNCTFETLPNETAFNILPSIGDETFIIAGNSYRGNGTLYKTGISGTSTDYANASQVGTITAVSGTPFGESIMTEVAHGLVEGQVITTTGFSDSNYNGTFEILEIVDADNFRIHTLFTATGTGSYTSDVLRITSIGHSLSIGDGIQLVPDSLVTGYRGGYLVIGAITDFFFVNQIFTTAGTGAWNTDSLTEFDPRMRVVANAGIPDSKILAFADVNANVLTTAVTAGVYTPLNVTGLTENAVTQRFVLTNTVIGEFTYIGAEDFEGQLLAVVSALKSGTARDYRFTVSVNGAIPIFATAPYAPMEVQSDKVNQTVLRPISLVEGDTVQIMVAGDASSDDLTVTDFTISIIG